MKKYSKVIAVFLVALMCLCACMFSVYADNDDGAQPADDGSGQSSYDGGGGGGEQGGGESSDVPYIPESDPGSQGGGESSDVPYIPEDGGQSSYVDGGGGYDGGDNQGSYDSGDTDGGNSSVYYDSDGNSYSNQEDVYVGGGQNYEPPASTAPPAALYKTDKKIDVNELSKNDWGDIANMLKNSGSAESDGDDFAFIQKNTKSGDNGNWIIIVGVICIVLSITGFIYLIASGVNRRKKMKAGNISKSTPQQRTATPGRASDDYNDGYGSTAKKSAKQPEKTDPAPHYGSGRSGKGGRRYR